MHHQYGERDHKREGEKKSCASVTPTVHKTGKMKLKYSKTNILPLYHKTHSREKLVSAANLQYKLEWSIH